MIILLTGYNRCGKDTIADYLTKKYEFRKYKFASKLKIVLQHLFGFSEDQLENTKEVLDTRWNITPRQAMEFVGTEMFQLYIQRLIPNQGRTFWASSLANDIMKDNVDNIVISDCRFPHEVNTIKSRFPNKHVLIVRVVRDNCGMSHHRSNHEHNSIHCDFEINNNYTVQATYKQLEYILKNYQL